MGLQLDTFKHYIVEKPYKKNLEKKTTSNLKI